MLDAALALAERDGIRAVTMEAVAQALRVTKPVVYACFGSREELVDQLLAREEARLVEGVLAALPTELDLGDPERMFTAGFTALVGFAAKHPGAWQLVLAPDPDPSVTLRYGRARARVSGRVAELMRVGLVAGGTTDVDRKLPLLVELFMSAGDAAVHAMVRGPTPWSPDELGAFVGRVVLGALRNA